MQTAGHLVGVLVEFPAGMQLGHDDLGRRDAFALVDVGRDAATVVAHRAGAIGIEHHVNLLGVARERLVDGIVDDLVDHVMQARTVIGVADIHARTLADRIEALKDLDRFRAVVGGIVECFRSLLTGSFSHVAGLSNRAPKHAGTRTWFDTNRGGRTGPNDLP